MNKLLQYLMSQPNVEHKILPGLQKMQKAGVVMFKPPVSEKPVYDNIPNPAVVRSQMVKDAAAKQVLAKRAADQAARDRQGYIRQAPAPKSMASKAWAIATNPMTALAYKAQGRDIPDNFELGKKNSLDIAANMVNPFFYVNEAKEFGRGAGDIIYKGVTDPLSLSGMDFLNTGMHALGAMPFAAEAVQGTNLLSRGLRGATTAYKGTAGMASRTGRVKNALNAGAIDLGYLKGDVTGHSYFNIPADDVAKMMSQEMAALPKGAFTFDGSMSKNSAPLFWTQAARSKGFTAVNPGKTQPLNWAGNKGKRISNALPENIESILPNASKYTQELQNRISLLKQTGNPESLQRAAQLEKDGITQQLILDLPYAAQNDNTIKGSLRQFLDNYKPTLDNPILEVNKKTGLNFPMTRIADENVGRFISGLYEQPSIYMVKGNPLSRVPQIIGDYAGQRAKAFFGRNRYSENPRIPFILSNAAYNAGMNIAGQKEKRYGGEPCYECGGSVNKYDVGGFYDCPDQEKDPVTGKCAADVARGRQANAANKAATKDMNSWAKQVAAMDKELAKQYAAQDAGQITFDYDWMQNRLDKADKKAAMAASKQFFQQNPNIFVADDTSGYSPEQKYIIASKLKQRLSTPMGSKLAQEKLGVDPRYYDLQRMQSELAPKMGGWNGMRNFLFNVYKEEGGEYDLPQAQWGTFVNPTTIAAMATMAAKAKEFFGFNEPKIVRTPASAPKRLSIRDPRKVMMTTGKPLRPNSDLVSGDYDSEDLGKLLTEAKRKNMSYNDMMNLAAMGFQETKWGKTDYNIGHTKGVHSDNPEEDAYQSFISAYNSKMKDADRLKIKDEATRLQVYNGLGKVFPSTEADYHGFKMKKIYGVEVPKGGIDLRKNPLYGKQVIDIRDNVLKRNPEFMRYMDSTYRAPMPKEEFANGGVFNLPKMQLAGKVAGKKPNTSVNSISNTLRDYEKSLDRWLGRPMAKAVKDGISASKEYFGPKDDPLDNFRHPMAGRYTSEAIQDKLGNIPILSQVAGFLGANALGAGHELSTLMKGSDTRPWGVKLRESAEDAFNNMVGAAVGSTPFISPEQKTKYLLNLSLNNKLPDGYGAGNMYIKKQGGPILDSRGQWAHPGKVTRIPSANITMQGVPYPVLGIGSNGQEQMMYPGQEYNFGGASYVDEYPMMQSGGSVPVIEDAGNFNEEGVWIPDHAAMAKQAKKLGARKVKTRSGSILFFDKNWNITSADDNPMMRNGGGLLSKSVSCSNCGWSWKAVEGGSDPLTCHKCGGMVKMKNGGQHGGLHRWFAEKWVDVKTGKDCGRQEGESRKGYPACRPSKRVSSETPKTSSEMSSAEKAKFKASKTSSQRINYNHKRNK